MATGEVSYCVTKAVMAAFRMVVVEAEFRAEESGESAAKKAFLHMAEFAKEQIDLQQETLRDADELRGDLLF